MLACGPLVALVLMLPAAALADPDEEARPGAQGGENLWVPSLSIIGGTTIQDQDGFADSFTFQGGTPPPVPLRGPQDGDDDAFGPFVGGALQLMSPALPIPTRPRFFLGAEILPTFASKRNLVSEGDPDCIKGPAVDAPCAADQEEPVPVTFGEDDANGQGTKVSAEIDTVTFGASVGMAFPFAIGERQLRFKPYAAYLSYEVETKGVVVNADCEPANRCQDLPPLVVPVDPPVLIPRPGFLRDTTLEATDSKRFHGIGPGFDLELDTGRFGPIGSSIYLGAAFYRILGNRKINFGASEIYDDPVCGANCPDISVADYKVKVNPWMYRTHVGIRLQWLGFTN
ncbi:MAG: hypothetical protein QNK04_22270 [Myxococcota bacterium]|nr:hypothetical protein [Myxococcota bacterium]